MEPEEDQDQDRPVNLDQEDPDEVRELDEDEVV